MSERLNSMSRDELLEFARFAYTAYPTLLVTHEKRLAFFKQYPSKGPNTRTEDHRQMSLELGEEEYTPNESPTGASSGP